MSSMKASRVIDVHTNEAAKASAQEPHRKNPLEMIWHRKWIVLMTTTICVLGALALYKWMTPVYTSFSDIQVQQPQARLLNSNSNGDPPVTNNLYTQAKVVTSTAVIADAVGLMEQKWQGELKAAKDKFQAAQDEYDKAFSHNGEVEFEQPIKSAASELAAAKSEAATIQATYDRFGKDTVKLNALKNAIKAVVGKEEDILTISYDSPSPREAQLVVACVVDAYKNFSSTEKHTAAKDSIDKIDADRMKWQQEIDQRRDKLLDTKARIDGLQVKSVTAESEQKLKSLSEALATAELESINAQAAYEDFARAAVKDPEKLATLLNAGKYNGMNITPGGDERTIQQDIHAAQQTLAELQQRYLPNHPAVQSAINRVGEINAQYVLFLHQRWVSAKNKVAALDDRYHAQKKSSEQRNEEVNSELNRRTYELAQLDAEMKQTQALMDSLLARSRELKGNDDFGTVNVKVLEPANLPTTPTRPVRTTMLFEGLLVGLIIGVSLTFLDQRLRSVEEITQASGLPVLGVIPHMPRNASPASRGRKVHLDPMSDVAEAYRAIRTAVYFGPRGAKTILITSPMRAEGKSTLASNLAIAMAEAGQKVLLVDGDLRLPTQHRIFATSNEVGLSTVVAGRTSADRSVQGSQIKGLEILPCGPIPFNPSETINNQTFADMLSDMAAKYDYVVVDSPPVMAVTDARILGAMCDLTLLVVRAEKTTRKSVADARDGLLGFGANLLGVIVNDGRRDKNRYGYYGGYGGQGKGQNGKAPAQVNGNRAGAAPGTDLAVSHTDRH